MTRHFTQLSAGSSDSTAISVHVYATDYFTSAKTLLDDHFLTVRLLMKRSVCNQHQVHHQHQGHCLEASAGIDNIVVARYGSEALVRSTKSFAVYHQRRSTRKYWRGWG
jgi:hypothetical protein